MQRKLLLLISLILTGILLLAGCGESKGVNSSSDSSKDDGKVIELNVNNWNPSSHQYVYNVFEPWKKLVEEETKGRVKVNIYSGATLGKSTSVLEDLTGGVYDVSIAIATYHFDSKLFPYTIGNLPYAFPDSEKAAKVLTKFGDKYAMDAFKDVHYLGGATSTDPFDLFSTKPIKTVKDVKGLKMRVQGKNDTPLIKNWGASPVSLASTDTYEALQKGTLNATLIAPTAVPGLKVYEVAPYITKMKIMVTPLIPLMSNNFYNKLPDDLKKLFDEDLGPKLNELVTKGYMKEVDKSYETFEKEIKGKGEIITPSSEALKEFSKSSQTVWENWIQEANSKGYPGKEMMEDFKKMLKEEGLETPF